MTPEEGVSCVRLAVCFLAALILAPMIVQLFFSVMISISKGGKGHE